MTMAAGVLVCLVVDAMRHALRLSVLGVSASDDGLIEHTEIARQ